MTEKNNQRLKVLGSMPVSIGQVLPGFFQSLIILGIIIVFHPATTTLLCGLVIYGAVMDYRKVKARGAELTGAAKRTFINSAWLIGFVAGSLWLYHFTGGWGILGMFLTIFVIAGFIVWRRWSTIKPLIQWWEKQFLGMTAEERRERKNNGDR